jgi:hypothetical protein
MWKSLILSESYPAFNGVQDFKLCEIKFAILIVPFNFETEKTHVDLQMKIMATQF